MRRCEKCRQPKPSIPSKGGWYHAQCAPIIETPYKLIGMFSCHLSKRDLFDGIEALRKKIYESFGCAILKEPPKFICDESINSPESVKAGFINAVIVEPKETI